MGSIGTIYSAKELSATYQPLLLCEFTLQSGDVLRVSTHPLSTGYGGSPTTGSYQYAGVPWTPRVLNQDFVATQAMSDLGVDIVPQVTVVLADPDKTILADWETPIGFKGAVLKVYAAMWDAGNSLTGSFNSDAVAPIKFIGTCSAAISIDQKTIAIVATSLLNMTQQQMPPVRIQSVCPWSFPPTPDARIDGQANSDSPYYQCGYSPDVSGGIGNYESGTASFTSCDLSFAACVERMGDVSASIPILQDTLGRKTGRYGGFDFVPIQNLGLQRPYITGQWELIINATNEARYGDYIPLLYGTTWIEPEIMGVYGDGNYTRFEALLGFGQVTEIINVVVNGDVVSQLSNDYVDRPSNHIISPAVTNSFKDNYWLTINSGQRNGNTNSIIGWSNRGDPYGSCAAIMVQVLASLAAASSLPQCQVLLVGGVVRVYTDPSTFTTQTSSNPAWILMDLLIQAAWRYDDLNIQSFINAAAVCDTQIYFNRIDGTYSNVYNESGDPEYLRYSIGFSVKQRTAIGDLIRGVRNAMRGILYFDFNNGLLTLGNKQTLSDQQPSPISGSNYDTPVESVTAAGASAIGYVAYNFDAGSILKDSNGRSTLKISQRQFQETPNKTTNYFFDRENQYSQDISTIIDVEDVQRIGAEITGNFNLIGPQTFDHLNRVTATWFAENYRGNPRLDFEGSFIGDTGGTIQFEWETSMKAIHLMVGQICLISDVQTGISNQEIRITRIQPSTNFETAKITALWHNDNWYQDTYGQGAHQPIYKNPMSGGQVNPRPWRPNREAPVVNDNYYDPTDKNFEIAQLYTVAADNTPLAQIQITGELPVNSFPTVSRPPRLELVGIGDTGGGYPTGTAYFVGISALGVSGFLSPLSNICAVKLDSSETALDLVAQSWPPEASGYMSFVGLSPDVMTLQTSAAVNPTLVQLKNTYQFGSWGAPDQAFYQFHWRLAKEIHSGVWGAEVVSVTSSTIKVAVYHNYGFTVNQWAGREVSVLGIQGTDLTQPTSVPIVNFLVESNTADTLTLSSGDPTTCVNGGSLQEGDAITMRLLPTFGNDTNGYYFEDLNLINSLDTVEAVWNIVGATDTSPVTVSLQIPDTGDFPFANGDTVVVQDVGGNDGANGGFVISSCDSTAWTFVLNSSTGTGTYTGGGVVGQQIQGLIPGEEAGFIAFIIAGTGKGTWVKIRDNTDTRYYIAGSWPVTPDETTRIIILDAVFDFDSVSNPISNNYVEANVSYNLPVNNYGRQTIFVSVGTASQSGLLSLQVDDPFREIFLYGNSAGVNLSVPNKAPFQVERTGYGTLTIMNLGIYGNTGVGAVQRIDFLVPSIDESDLGVYGIGSIDGSTDPVTFTPSTLANSSRYGSAGQFQEGDYLVWDDAGHYECDQLLKINGDGSWKLQRNPGDVSSGTAYFGSLVSAHSGKAFFRLIPKLFSNAIQQNAIGQAMPATSSGIPSYWEYVWAAKCVIAVVSQVIGENGNSETFILNMAQSTIPGYRTLNGGMYTVGALRTPMAVGMNADKRIRVTAPETLRVVSADVTTAPTGADLKVRAVFVTADLTKVGLIDSLTIADGSNYSFSSSSRPESQDTPYHATEWSPTQVTDEDYPPTFLPGLINLSGSPFNTDGSVMSGLTISSASVNMVPFAQGGFIDFVTEQVGSANPGINFQLFVET